MVLSAEMAKVNPTRVRLELDKQAEAWRKAGKGKGKGKGAVDGGSAAPWS